MGAGAWRSRACALALMLTLYLAIAALISGLHDAVSSIPRSLSVSDFAAPPKYSPKVTELDLHQRMRSALEFAGGGLVGWGTGGKTSGRFRPRLIWCSQLRYQRPPGPAVALASFPGSGNTWLRYLLQQATGIYTGSVYKDYGLMKNGFPAESISNGSALVVKTHEWGSAAREPFSRALLLVRQPAAAILAEFNRQSGGHVGFAAPERYRRMKGKYWQQFVINKLAAWKQTNLDWLYNFTGPTHIVFYDQLVGDVEHTLRGILNFLGVPINRSQFACAITRKEGIYRRKKRLLNFDPFTPQMKLILQHEQEIVYQALYSALSGTTNNVNNYS